MPIASQKNCSTPAAASDASLMPDQRSACLDQVNNVAADLARLQSLLDEAMSRLGNAFTTLAHAAEADRHEDARDVLVTTLQYHDVCSQLLGHARSRLDASRTLIESDVPLQHHELNLPARPPVLHADLAPGAIELF